MLNREKLILNKIKEILATPEPLNADSTQYHIGRENHRRYMLGVIDHLEQNNPAWTYDGP